MPFETSSHWLPQVVLAAYLSSAIVFLNLWFSRKNGATDPTLVVSHKNLCQSGHILSRYSNSLEGLNFPTT